MFFRRLAFITQVTTIFMCLITKSESRREISCGKPGHMPSCTYEPQQESYFTGDQVVYYCLERCHTFDNLTRTCQESGIWSGKIPTCYPELNVSNIRTIPASDDSKEFTANLLQDKSKSTCMVSRLDHSITWEMKLEKKSSIILIKIDLTISVQVRLKVYAEDIRRNETKNCSEAKNYIGIGSSLILYCQKSFEGDTIKIHMSLDPYQTTSANYRLCEVSVYTSYGTAGCLRADTPLNGNGQKIVGTDSKPTTYHFNCKEGYDLIGPSQVQCLADGSWNSTTTICRKKTECKMLPKVANGVVRTNSTFVNGTAFLQCNEGFRPLSIDKISCLINGSWSSNSLRCTPIECDLNPYIPHGRGELLNRNSLYGSWLKIHCDPYYKASVSELRQCGSDGSWGDVDICVEINCGPLNVYENLETGEWMTFNLSLPILLVLVCEPGFHFEGFPPFIQCLPNGSWTHSTAVCRRSPEAQAWDWRPSSLFMSAIAVGAATSVCLLCLAMCIFVIKKRYHLKSDSAVFPLSKSDSAPYDKVYNNTPINAANTAYEEVIEMSSSQQIPQENLPLETDPVYAQPFETTIKISICPPEDLYSTHIYAEPIDSKLIVPETTLNCVSETWLRTGAKKFGRKVSLPDHSTYVHDRLVETNNSPTIGTGFVSPSVKESLQKCSDNSLVTQLVECADDNNLSFSNNFNQLQMIDNDLYQGNYFSSV